MKSSPLFLQVDPVVHVAYMGDPWGQIGESWPDQEEEQTDSSHALGFQRKEGNSQPLSQMPVVPQRLSWLELTQWQNWSFSSTSEQIPLEQQEMKWYSHYQLPQLFA